MTMTTTAWEKLNLEEQGNMTYKGFDIDNIFRIFKDGNQIFTAYWQNCYDLDHAKKRIDNSLEAKAKFDRLPNLNRISELNTEPVELENGLQAAEEFTGWMDKEAEQQNYEHEQNY